MPARRVGTFLPGTRGREALVALERAAKVCHVVEAAGKASLGHGDAFPHKQAVGYVHTVGVEVVYKSLAGVLTEVCGVGATFPGPSTNALLFFSLGAFFRLRGIDVVQFVRRRRGLLLSASLVLLAFSTACYEEKYAQQLHQAFYIAGIFVLILFASALIGRKWVCVHPLLVKSSFFVFAVHMVPVGYGSLLSLGGSVRHLLFPTASIAGAVAGYAFAMCFIAGAGVLLYLLLEKLAPRVLKVLSGGR